MKLVAFALFAAAAATPLQRRGTVTVTEVVWLTEIETVTEILDVSTTTFVTPGQSVPTADATPIVPAPSDGQFFETASLSQEQPKQTSVAAPAPPPPPSSTAPPPQPTAEPAPAPAPASPEPTSFDAAPQPSSSSEAKPVPSSTGGSGGGSDEHNGEITYFDVGTGACGENDTGKDDTENIVALSSKFMGPLSNTNPLCNQKIKISANGKSIVATIRDKCPICDERSIDVSKAAYRSLFGSLDSGRSQCSWSVI